MSSFLKSKLFIILLGVSVPINVFIFWGVLCPYLVSSKSYLSVLAGYLLGLFCFFYCLFVFYRVLRFIDREY